jgi:hypothetical protein
VDTVLGLSVTATNIQTVLVEGRSADGATLEHDAFDVVADAESPNRASEQVAEAVLSLAETDGHRLHAIGVTWSEDADREASLVIDSLAGLGFANVVAVRSPRAVEALTRSIGRMIGYQRTAVCVLEPDTAILSLVDTHDGEVETVVSHTVDSDEQLAVWLESIFERDDWRPEGLFLVGSVGGLESLVGWLEHRLDLPVFDPPEADLALAHGAALASATPATESLLFSVTPNVDARRRAVTGPLAMLIGGAIALVVSVALAIGPHLIPERGAVTSARHEVDKAAVTPPAPKVAPAPAPPPAAPAPAPPPEAPAPDPVQELPAPPPAAPVEDVPAYDPGPSIEAISPPAPDAPLGPIAPIAPPPPAPVVMAPAPPQVPEKPRLRDRILDKIPGFNRFGN